MKRINDTITINMNEILAIEPQKPETDIVEQVEKM